MGVLKTKSGESLRQERERWGRVKDKEREMGGGGGELKTKRRRVGSIKDRGS